MNYGELLEQRISKACEMYRWRGTALIRKIPTPVKVIRKNKYGRIVDGFFDSKSSVDFEGVSHGRHISFEAKSTTNRTSFALKNIHQHQLDYLRDTLDQGGISFFLIEFAKTGEIYFCWYKDIQEFWNNAFLQNGKKSIPKSWFDLNCPLVKPSRWVSLDFLRYCLPTESKAN